MQVMDTDVQADGGELTRLREENAVLRAMIEDTGDAVSRRTPDGTLLSFNRGAEELYGYRAADVVGGDAFVVVPPECVALEREMLAAATRGDVQRYETQRLRADGRRLRVAITLSPVRDASGAVTSISAITRDVTERRDAQHAAEEAMTELERSNAELAQFAYVASHDLSEPLRSIGGFLSLLEHRYDDVLDEQGRDYIRRVLAASKRMRTLIDDLLDYSRASRAELEPVEVDLGAVVRTAIEAHRERIAETGAVVEVGELPVVAADPGGMAQVLQNLLANALKFHREGEPPRVRISALHRPGAWELSVADAGIGIEPRHRTRVFEIFKRLNPATAYAGTGIGLSVCKAVVERHGGRVLVEDSPLGGVCFTLVLPAGEDPA